MNNRKSLLKQIQIVDFALHETVLYLDGHPTDRKAMAYYKSAKQRLKALMDEYTEKYGPLNYYLVSGNSWSWIDKPWPWQNEKEA